MKKAKSRRLQLKGVDGQTVNLGFPGTVPAEEVRGFKNQAQRLVQCQRGNLHIPPKTVAWVESCGDDFRSKLKRLGIKWEGDEDKEQSIKCQLGPFLSRYTSTKRGDTERKLINTARRLERFFGPKTDMRSITRLDAEAFWNWLLEHEQLAENSTARRSVGYAMQIFAAAEEEDLITKNPFKGRSIPKTVRTDPSKHHLIDADETQRIWAALDCDEDRLRFVLLRFLGLRAPTELDALRWKDFDWQSGMVTIRSKKTEHHKHQGIRKCPFIHPQVEPVVREAHAKRESDDEAVLPKISGPALRKRVLRWLGRPGLEQWPQLLVNFRRTAVTEALNDLPAHVAAAYFGHSEIIAAANYAMRTKEHAVAFGASGVPLTTLRVTYGEEVA